MTSFTTIVPGTDLVAGKPITQAKMQALYNNLLAALEGDPTSPGIALAAIPSVGKILLDTKTASGSANIQFTSLINATYPVYEIHCTNIVPAAGGDALRMVMSKDAGATYEATSYNVHSEVVKGDGTDLSHSAINDTYIQFTGNSDGVSASASYSGLDLIITLFNPSATVGFKNILFTGAYAGSTGAYWARVRGSAGGTNANLITNALNALKFYFSTGNIASGKFRLYGMRA